MCMYLLIQLHTINFGIKIKHNIILRYDFIHLLWNRKYQLRIRKYLILTIKNILYLHIYNFSGHISNFYDTNIINYSFNH